MRTSTYEPLPSEGTVEAWCHALIVTRELGSKLAPPAPPDLRGDESWEDDPPVRRLPRPGRPSELRVIARSPKTPRARALVRAEVRAGLVHTFLHHELQAAELFAWAVLAFPETPRAFRAGLVGLCRSELEHLALYVEHLERLGDSVGDFPVRDWFWERVGRCPDPASFVALLGLGLEGANLEHSARFATWFRDAGDKEGACILERVAEEEIAHVAFASSWFARFTGEPLDYDRWCEKLPAPLTPALLRGVPLNREARRRAGLDERFLERLEAEPPASGGGAMSDEPRAWVLNLDAEHELEVGRGYAPTRHLRGIVARESRRLLGNLVRPGDVVLTDESDLERARGLPGRCWSPTPRALALLERAGAVPERTPSFDAVRTVNTRPFAVGVRAPLVRSSFEKRVVATLDDALRLLSRPAVDGWLVRRSFGAAGRGRRRIEAGRPAPEDVAWLRASLRRGALVVEPWVHVTREYTRNGWVHADGSVVIAASGFQETTKSGAWIRTEQARLDDVGRDDDARLEEAAAAAGTALADAGYFGPFGIDAFRHRALSTSGPREVLNPLSEINARYTMDFVGA